jgi:hypothetical protein
MWSLLAPAFLLMYLGLLVSLRARRKNDIWMRENQGLYEYIAVYVDNIMIATKSPADIIEVL